MRGRPLYLAIVVIVALAAVPAVALAAEEAPGVPAEAPASEAPPPSTGWVPQTPAAEDTNDAPASAQQGSSLGSGGRSTPAPSTSEPPPAPEPSSPSPAPTESYYEPEAPAPPATEASTSAPDFDAAPAPAPAPEPVAKPEPENRVPPALGGAEAVERPTSGVAGEFAASAAAAEQVASSVTGDSGGLPWLALILCGLVLLYAGVRLLLGPVEPDFFRSGRFRFVRRVFPGA